MRGGIARSGMARTGIVTRRFKRPTRDVVCQAIDSYNASVWAPINGPASNGDAHPAEFVVDEIDSGNGQVITSGEFVGVEGERRRWSSRVTLVWFFDATGNVAEIRAVRSP